ncbi:hypothetical protein QJS66_08730 [Kocuria rhizophila]|nr:hypothetical protein QJS66_08730 [Kocuria rhizophila]
MRFDRQAKPGVSDLLTIYSSLTGTSRDTLVAEYRGRGAGQPTRWTSPRWSPRPGPRPEARPGAARRPRRASTAGRGCPEGQGHHVPAPWPRCTGGWASSGA